MSDRVKARARTPAGLTASLLCIAVNLSLFALKLVAGLLGNAPSLVSDAVHSLSDLLSTGVLLVGLRLSLRAPDKKHPYGHERFECLASLVLSGILLVTGISIGVSALRSILSGAYASVVPPRVVAAVVAAVSIGAKLALALYMRRTARKTRSSALRAEATHQISDALASLGALLGILLSILGLPLFEPLASILIAGFLVNAAVGIFREAAGGVLDCSAGDELEARITEALCALPPYVAVTAVTTRRFSSRVYAEVALTLDGDLPLAECDAIASAARESLLGAVHELKDCVVTARPTEANAEAAGASPRPTAE